MTAEGTLIKPNKNDAHRVHGVLMMVDHALGYCIMQYRRDWTEERSEEEVAIRQRLTEVARELGKIANDVHAITWRDKQ